MWVRIPDGRFLTFEVSLPNLQRSTVVVSVRSRKTGELEGEIRWYGRRGYSLFPTEGTVFGPVCLSDCARVCKDLTEAHRGQQRLELQTEATA